jgi:hypothetical protein
MTSVTSILDGVVERVFPDRMPRSDKRAWATAETLADLGVLMKDFLYGEVSWSPVHLGAVDDDETGPYIHILADACLSGFVTMNSQAGWAGIAWTGSYVECEAWVTGYIEDADLEVMQDAIRGTGLIMRRACRKRAHAGHRRYGFRACPKAGEDGSMTERCPRAAGVIEDCWLIEIADTVPARNDVLWPALERFAELKAQATS